MMIKRGVSGSVEHFSDNREAEIEAVKADINNKKEETEVEETIEAKETSENSFVCPGLTEDEE